MMHRALVLSFQEGTTWMSWCLDFDLMGQGDSPEEAEENLRKVLELAVESSALRSRRAVRDLGVIQGKYGALPDGDHDLIFRVPTKIRTATTRITRSIT